MGNKLGDKIMQKYIEIINNILDHNAEEEWFEFKENWFVEFLSSLFILSTFFSPLLPQDDSKSIYTKIKKSFFDFLNIYYSLNL